MSKEIFISSTPHETRLAIVEDDALTEMYYERENEYTLAGSIYNGKVTRVLPGMQSSFVDIGLERDAFLYITDFMEEAGDAADFEANANSGDHARAPRAENGRSENGRSEGRGRSERGNREQPRELAARTEEPTDAELFTEAVSGLDPARPVGEGERSGNRRGGRNRRDRNQGAEGASRREGGAREAEAPRAQSSSAAEPILQSGNQSDHPSGDRPGADSADALGEGAPGADGSRRWRGRRGRRGSRGPERDGNSQPVETANEVQLAATGPIYDSYPTDPAEVDTAEGGFDLAAASGAASFPNAGGNEHQNRNEHQGGNEQQSRGGRRERGQQRSPKGPRGFTPSSARNETELAPEDQTGTAAYGVEPEDTGAPHEAVILPGESLAKYRAGGEVEPTRPETTAVPSPSTEFKLAEGWDGGFVLPGETLRRREPESQHATDQRSDANRSSGREGRGDRNRSDRGGKSEAGRSMGNKFQSMPLPSAVAASDPRPAEFTPASSNRTSVQDQPVVEQAVVQQQSVSQQQPVSQQQTIDSTFVPPPPMPSQPSHAAPPAQEPAAHGEAIQGAVEQPYEPSEASASYRVDPAPPSEFRQPAPVLETAAFAESASEATPAVPLNPAHATSSELDPAALHTVSPALRSAFEHQAALQHEAVPHEAVSHEAVPAPDLHSASMEGHALTSISAEGEMHSEPQSPASHETNPQEAADPASPIKYESAVVDATSPTQHFAPGRGLLEEEVMEEDEEGTANARLMDLHASSAGEEGEQETLEGGADLGVMLREMSIDQITRASLKTGEEEDFEEDFLEEDQDYESSDLDEEELGQQEIEDEPAGEQEDALDGEPNHAEGQGSGALTGAPDHASQEPRREGRRDERGRRDGRRGDRNRKPDSEEATASAHSERSNGNRERPPVSTERERSGDRHTGRRDGRGGRQSMQTTNLPAISELLKPGQELLCQIAKEPIAKKGARITSHIALPGRFLVFMPTVNHTGVSRKIESDSERRRLKEILLSEKGEASGGFIVRTAAAGASEEELRSDLRFLLNLWTDIKQRSESSKSPALIYHDLNLVERVLRDQVTDTFSAIWVDTEPEFERVLRFLQRFQPSLIRRVKLYTKETPLFEQFGITEEINKALRSKVWLKSGGSIVINQTEALVAIDINTGKFVGKTARLEDTIVKTNLDAIPEIVRQIRLRDLGGIIIIDFIDMEERKNRNRVMAALEEELKLDRAPSKVLPFNDFGLIAITRKRVKQSLERTLSTPCGICQGTGMVKSPVSVCNDIYIEMRKMHKHLDRGDVMLRVNPEVVKQLKSTTSKWLQEMEEMLGKTILVKSDPSLHPEQFDIH